ncbi:MAG: hypothetical protein WC222_12405 [Parachlamydiales bacterium]|jgi:hypothetical protein
MGILQSRNELDIEFADHESQRPLRDLILLLPHIQARRVGGEFHIDWQSAAPELLLQLGHNAEITQRTVNRGVAAIGRLLVAVSPEVGLGEIPADCVESIGWLLAELGDLGSTSTEILTACQRYTSDYSPDSPLELTPTARP